jgi:hypothetical protein
MSTTAQGSRNAIALSQSGGMNWSRRRMTRHCASCYIPGMNLFGQALFAIAVAAVLVAIADLILWAMNP